MGLLDKMKSWLSGRREEKQVSRVSELPKQERKVTIYEEEEDFSKPPKLDEYAEIEFTKPKKKYGKQPAGGTNRVKKKTAKRKTTKKKKVTKKKTAKRKTAKKKTTKRKTTTRKKATKKKTTKRKTTKRKTAKKKRR